MTKIWMLQHKVLKDLSGKKPGVYRVFLCAKTLRHMIYITAGKAGSVYNTCIENVKRV